MQHLAICLTEFTCQEGGGKERGQSRARMLGAQGLLHELLGLVNWVSIQLLRKAGACCCWELEEPSSQEQPQPRTSTLLPRSPLSFPQHPCRFQKLHLACGSERLVLHSPLQPRISLCEAPASPLQLPGGNVTITYSYAGARAPMGQGFLLTYSQGMPTRGFRQAVEAPKWMTGGGRRAQGLHASQPLSVVLVQIG